MKTKFIKLKNVAQYLPKMLYDETAVTLIDDKLRDMDTKIDCIKGFDSANAAGEIWRFSESASESIFLDFQMKNRNGSIVLSIVTETIEGGGQPFRLSFTFNHGRLQHQMYVPVQYLLKSWNPDNKHSLYCHILDEKPYYGITRRHWADDRWEEHVADAKNGKKRLLWDAIQNTTSDLVCHVLLGTGYTKEEAMHLEEFWVDQWGLYPRGLNMIPGGYAGHRFLAKNNLLGRSFLESDIDEVLRQSEARSRAARENWASDDYAEKIICGGERRLTKQQVQRIRALFREGLGASDIAPFVEARSERQVQGVIDGKTYSRIS